MNNWGMVKKNNREHLGFRAMYDAKWISFRLFPCPTNKRAYFMKTQCKMFQLTISHY